VIAEELKLFVRRDAAADGPVARPILVVKFYKTDERKLIRTVDSGFFWFPSVSFVEC